MVRKKSPKSLVPVGNTETGTRKACKRSEALHWQFTFNNYLDVYKNGDEVAEILKNECVKFVFQEEIGEASLIIHLQGYVHFKKKKLLTGVKKLLGDKVHWEVCNNIDACIRYCNKADTHTGKRWSVGFPKEIKIISELRPFQISLLEICLETPDDRSIIWVYDDKGNMGKTQFLKYMCVKYNAIFTYGGKKADIINLVFNNKDYLLNNDKAIMLYSIPRDVDNKHISYESMEQVKDGCISNTKFECGCFVCNSPHLIVLANCPPNMCKLTADRWKVFSINDNYELIDYVEENDIDNISTDIYT